MMILCFLRNLKPFSITSLDLWYASSFISLFTFGGTAGVVLRLTSVDVLFIILLMCLLIFTLYFLLLLLIN